MKKLEGTETLKGRRDRAKLKWWYKLATMPEEGSLSSYLVKSGIKNSVEGDKGKHGVE